MPEPWTLASATKGFVAPTRGVVQRSRCLSRWRDARRGASPLESARGYWLTKETGITIVAPPPSGGANCALWTRETTHETTAPESPLTPPGDAERTSPFGPIFAVILTDPFMVGSSARP